LYVGLVTTSNEGHTVFGESPEISDKSYTSVKEIQLYRQTEETGTYHIANKKCQRRHDSSLHDRQGQGSSSFNWQTATMDYEATA